MVTRSLRAKRLLVTAVLLVVLALLLRASVKAPDQLNFVDRLLLRMLAPVQGAVVRVGQRISDAFSHYAFLVSVKRDNERLVQENGALRAQLLGVSQLAARAERLERLLELRSQVLADTVAAEVVSVETSRQLRVLRVRLHTGSPSGYGEVKAGMPVLSPSGVVGRVARTVGPYSDVQLATDPRSSIDVVLPRTGSRGVLKGLSSDTRYVCRVEYLVQKDEVQLGDVVVTSGLGGLFPRDIPVGRVVGLKKSDASLYQEVEVEPLVDFGKLREVLVVLSKTPTPDPDAGHRPSEGVRGVGVPR